MGESAATLTELRAAAQSSPDDVHAWLELSEAFIEHGDVERAALSLRHAHALAAEDPPSLVRASRLYRRLDDPVEASNAARRALHLDPKLESAALAVAELLLDHGDADAAVLSLRAAAHNNPASGRIQLALAEAFAKAGRPQEALRHVDKGTDPDASRVLRLKAEIFEGLGRDDDELDALRRLLQRSPEDVDAALRLGELLSELGHREEAAALLTRVAEHPPHRPDSLVRLGRALTRCQALKPAVRSLREAIRISPDLAQAHFQLGRTLLAGGVIDEAIASLRTAADLAPEDPNIGFALGTALRKAGRLREAAAALIKAAAAAPEEERIQDVLAETLATLKTPSQGIAVGPPPVPGAVPRSPLPSENTDGGFTGDLAIFSLPELMEFLCNQRATGELQVHSEDEVGALRLHRGAIVSVTYPGGKNLGDLLIESELITRTDLKRNVVQPKDLDRDAIVAHVVVSRNLVDREAVQEFMRRRVLEGVRELVTWRTGSVLFRRQPPPAEPPEFEVDSRWALLESLRRLDEDGR